MKLADVSAAAAALHLTPLGGFHDDQTTTILLGPLEPGFWEYVSNRPEFKRGGTDPLDHWSQWAITALGYVTGAIPLFPFGAAPHNPFISWALRSGEAWASPVGLIVHRDAGLLASYRGALKFDQIIDLPAPSVRPCEDCHDKPCVSACPISALGTNGYDVPSCKSHVTADAVCRAGCQVRLACPISQSYGRNPEQTAFHMGAFLGE